MKPTKFKSGDRVTIIESNIHPKGTQGSIVNPNGLLVLVWVDGDSFLRTIDPKRLQKLPTLQEQILEVISASMVGCARDKNMNLTDKWMAVIEAGAIEASQAIMVKINKAS